YTLSGFDNRTGTPSTSSSSAGDRFVPGMSILRPIQYIRQFVAHRYFQLFESAALRVPVGAPAQEACSVTKTHPRPRGAFHLVVGHLDHTLRAQRHPAPVHGRAPPGGFPF